MILMILYQFIIIIQILRRGANVNDKDGLTGLTLLHYACKSGAGKQKLIW